MIDNTICPSCNMKKDDKHMDKPLCFYCYYRGNHNTTKMVILEIFSKSLNKLTVEDVVENLNVLPYKGKKDFSNADVEKLMRRYTKRERTYAGETRIEGLGLLSASKCTLKRPRNGGRKKLYYQITRKGRRVLARYKQRWLDGKPLQVRKKKRKNNVSFVMIREYKERATSIRGILRQGLILNKEYDIYQFIFTRRRYT